jgi:hypothetical protein
MSVPDRLQRLFDLPILSHGFAPFQRDYVVESEIGGRSNDRGRYRFTFTHTVIANVTTTVSDTIWLESWDDRFTAYDRWQASGEPQGIVWGVNWSMAYPGPTYVHGSLLAEQWTARLGHAMHEAHIETEMFRLQLVFHELRIERTGDDVSVYDRVSHPIK